MTRVLLVDDCPDLLTILQIELEDAGYDVEVAEEAAAALAAARCRRPDIIVSDLGLPGVDGFEFIKHVRATPGLASIPAIALTGSSLDSDVQQALAFGFTAYITKPVEADELRHRIEQLTARWLDRKAG